MIIRIKHKDWKGNNRIDTVKLTEWHYELNHLSRFKDLIELIGKIKYYMSNPELKLRYNDREFREFKETYMEYFV